jgi:hypothetical protein
MKEHNKTSGHQQPKGRQVVIKPQWFMKSNLVRIGVWEGNVELAAFLTIVEVLEDNRILMGIVKLLVGREAVLIEKAPLKNKGE